MIPPRRIVLIGATGSIGTSTLEVIKAHKEAFQLVAIANGQRAEELQKLARDFDLPPDRTVCAARDGDAAVCALGALPEADIVLLASSGTASLQAAFTAIEAGKTIALAAKEILLLAGHLLMPAARARKVSILPVDSEHNGLFQCLQSVRSLEDIRRIYLTASGGPFRDWPIERIRQASPRDALQHPNWSMGRKITVDSATLANKGLEMIEARWLFDLPPEKIGAVVHRQSIVHAFLEFQDGSTLAQLSPPSMTFAIQHCLSHPERLPAPRPGLDFSRSWQLDFEAPDPVRFPCLRLAREAMIAGGAAPLVFNCANSVAVEAFLGESLPFYGIPELIEQCLSAHDLAEPLNVDGVVECEKVATRLAMELLKRQSSTP
jgi:1-deoxy-D-xylulose-5-phosphate reductoisomerase